MKVVTVQFLNPNSPQSPQNPYCSTKDTTSRLKVNIAENYKKKKLIQEFNSIRIKSIFENYKRTKPTYNQKQPIHLNLLQESQVAIKSKTQPDELIQKNCRFRRNIDINNRLQCSQYYVKAKLEESTQNLSNSYKSTSIKRVSEEEMHMNTNKIQNFQFSSLPQLNRKSESSTKLFKTIFASNQTVQNQDFSNQFYNIINDESEYSQNLLQNEKLRERQISINNHQFRNQPFVRKTSQNYKRLENRFFGVFNHESRTSKPKQRYQNFENIKRRIMEKNDLSSFNKSEQDHGDFHQQDFEEYFHYYVQNQKQCDLIEK